MKNRFSQTNDVENGSNVSQSVSNIEINHQKHILDLYKWRKDHPKKSGWNPPPKKKFPNGKDILLNEKSTSDIWLSWVYFVFLDFSKNIGGSYLREGGYYNFVQIEADNVLYKNQKFFYPTGSKKFFTPTILMWKASGVR